MDVDDYPSASSTHPNPQPNPHHRKVDLQSSHDLSYLQGNLSRSALQKLDLHFPKLSKPAIHISLDGQGDKKQAKAKTADQNGAQQDGGKGEGIEKEEEEEEEDEEEDPMRRRVRDLVSEFLSSTWTSASHNISVNGIDASALPIPHTATLSRAPPPPAAPGAGTDASTRTTTTTTTTTSTTGGGAIDPPAPREEVEGKDFQYTAFDPKLQLRLAALHGELEALTAQVSRLRRTAPEQGAAAYERRLAEVVGSEETRYEAATRKVAEGEDGDVEEGLEVESVRDGWNEDVRDIYERGVRELAGLAGTGTGQGAAQLGSHHGYSGRDGGGEGLTLTEIVGKAQRANRVAMEME